MLRLTTFRKCTSLVLEVRHSTTGLGALRYLLRDVAELEEEELGRVVDGRRCFGGGGLSPGLGFKNVVTGTETSHTHMLGGGMPAWWTDFQPAAALNWERIPVHSL